jgi:hypothetical protein
MGNKDCKLLMLVQVEGEDYEQGCASCSNRGYPCLKELLEIVENGSFVSFLGPSGDPSMVSYHHLLKIGYNMSHLGKLNLVTTGTLKQLQNFKSTKHEVNHITEDGKMTPSINLEVFGEYGHAEMLSMLNSHCLGKNTD